MVKPSFEAETPATPVRIKAAAAKTNPKYFTVFFMVHSIFIIFLGVVPIDRLLKLLSAADVVPYIFFLLSRFTAGNRPMALKGFTLVVNGKTFV
jgi:hypothetical protein